MANIGGWIDEDVEEEEPMEVPEPFEIGPDGHGVAVSSDEEEDPEEEPEEEWADEEEVYTTGSSPPPASPTTSMESDPPTPPPAAVESPAEPEGQFDGEDPIAFLDRMLQGDLSYEQRHIWEKERLQIMLRNERADWGAERFALQESLADRYDEIASLERQLQRCQDTLSRYRYIFEKEGRKLPR